MNILFIHPSNKILGKADAFLTREFLTPVLGLGSLAGFLRKNGVECGIIDLRLPHRDMEDVYRYVQEKNPLMVGITAFTTEITAAASVAERLKDRFPRLTVGTGGPHATLMPVETLEEFPQFDLCVLGEGEETALELLDALKSGGKESLSSIKGIVYREDGAIKAAQPRVPMRDIDALPFPAWDLFEIEHYNNIFVVNTSRGCPYPCYFCSPDYLGKKVRVRDYKKVVDEIEYLVERFGARKIQFADATLSLLGDSTRRMCQELIDRGLSGKVEWICETRADSVDLPLLQVMKEAGCRWIALGVETGNERILKEVVRKGETREQIREAVRMAKKAGVKVRCFFIIGHYTETVETIKDTINFARELNPDALSFGLLVPNPGSEFRRMAERGLGGMRILHNRWEDYNQYNYDCYELENLPLKELKRWQSRAYYSFYARHPVKGLGLFMDRSGYNYSFKAILKVPVVLLRNMIRK